MLYRGDGQVIEAVGAGVKKTLAASALDHAILAIALRRRNLTATQRGDVLTYANEFWHRNLPYDYVGAGGAGASGPGRGSLLAMAACTFNLGLCGSAAGAVASNARPETSDQAFFCSELVARVFELAGAPISDARPSYTTPRMVRVSRQLLYVGHLKDN
jgi:hypothetical protein